MRRYQKKGTGLYEYLDSAGVLSNGTDEEIKKQKAIYWTNYRKQWKKNKRQQSKVYVLMVSFSEARFINQKANQLSVTPVSFIKYAALSDNELLGPVLLGKVREQLILYGSRIEEILSEMSITDNLKNIIVEQIAQMEKSVLSVIQQKKGNHDY